MSGKWTQRRLGVKGRPRNEILSGVARKKGNSIRRPWAERASRSRSRARDSRSCFPTGETGWPIYDRRSRVPTARNSKTSGRNRVRNLHRKIVAGVEERPVCLPNVGKVGSDFSLSNPLSFSRRFRRKRTSRIIFHEIT